MAVYRCPACDEMKDNDYSLGIDINGELHCESCANELDESEISNKLEICAYLHCGKCLEELPPDTSPQEWGVNEIGWTPAGLQVWCKRHECNVVNIDFEGHTHPADSTIPKELKLEVVK